MTPCPMALLALESSHPMCFIKLQWSPIPCPGPESYPDAHCLQGLSADLPFLDSDLQLLSET